MNLCGSTGMMALAVAACRAGTQLTPLATTPNTASSNVRTSPPPAVTGLLAAHWRIGWLWCSPAMWRELLLFGSHSSGGLTPCVLQQLKYNISAMPAAAQECTLLPLLQPTMAAAVGMGSTSIQARC
jgi:hypothetical protein